MNFVANTVATQAFRQKPGYLYLASIWGAALILSLMTYLQPGTHLWPGLDQAWAYGINYAFDKKLVMGRDIYFTFGPLGWLEHTRMVSNRMLYFSSAFSAVISLAMNVAVLHLAWQSTINKSLRALNVIAVIALIVFSFPEMQRLLIFEYALIFLHWTTKRNIYLVLLSCSITFCIFVKFSYGAAALSLWIPYLALLYYHERKSKIIYMTLASLVVSYVIVWLIMYGSLSGAFGYLQGEFYISSGNASAMAINPENNWLAILGFYISCLLAAVVIYFFSDRRYAALPIIFIFPLFVWTKYSFSQEQALHFVPLLDFSFYVAGIFFIVAPRLLQKITLLVLLASVCLTWKAMHTEAVGSPDYDNVPHVTINKPEVVQYHFKFKKLFSIWRTAEKERLQPLSLPIDMREKIGDTSVDIYPWELGIAAANNLNWHPRPVFQTYVDYLPFLDRKNYDFYSSEKAPEYIVWHHHDFQDVMNRYSLSSEPMTTESILRHYQLIECEGIFCLWKHAEQDQLQSVNEINTKSVKWNEWIPVPVNKESNNADIIRAKLLAKRTFLGKLNLFFWKEGGLTIDYQLEGGVVKTHDLLIDNAVSGLWISPYFEQYLGDTTASRVEEISTQKQKLILSQTPAQGYIDRIEPTLMGRRLVGWAFDMSADSALQQQYILLFNSEKSFLLRANNMDRSDVAAHFATQGKIMPNLCGFYEEIADQQLPAGDYKLRFVVKHIDVSGSEKWAAIADQGFTLHVDATTGKNKVVAVRFRTTRPWAFLEKMDVQWQQLNFTEHVPWE